jgi:hypothetical protein
MGHELFSMNKENFLLEIDKILLIRYFYFSNNKLAEKGQAFLAVSAGMDKAIFEEGLLAGKERRGWNPK